jgi:hypothetical protein
MSFGPGRKRGECIRKDAGELTPADYARFPVWEFALDEEGIKGQNECTVRPVHPVAWPDVYDYIVGATATFASGRIQPAAFATTFLDVEEKTNPQSLSQWLLLSNGKQINLDLPPEGFVPNGETRRAMDSAYADLRAKAEEVFPLTLQPLVVVPGLPTTWKLPGFKTLRPTSDADRFRL